MLARTRRTVKFLSNTCCELACCSVTNGSDSFETPRTAALQAPRSSTIFQTLLKFLSIPGCYLTISYSVAPFSFCLQSFPASRSFPMSRLPASGGQSIGVSASVLSVNIQGWFPLGLTGLISLQTPRSLLQHHDSNALIVYCSAFFMVQLSRPYMTTGKTIALTIQTFICQSDISAF